MRSALVPILLADPMPWAFKAPYAWDFLRDRARFAGGYKGALANTPGWSYTRADAQNAYAQNAAGVLTAFASGVLRRTDKGVLIEGARTNLCLQSQDFATTWTRLRINAFGSGSVVNATTAPDGTSTADFICEDTNNDTHFIRQAVTVSSGVAHTFSVYAKAGTRSIVTVGESATTLRTATFDLSAGTVSNVGSSITATITALADGWYRCAITYTTASTTFNADIGTRTTSGAGFQTYTGDGASGLYLWGAQLEAASFPSSYIPTTTASATRAADVLSVPVSGIDYPLSLYAEWEKNGDDSVNPYQRVIEVGRASSTDQAVFYHRAVNNNSKLYATSGGAAQADLSTGTSALNTTCKMAGRFATNDFAASLGGAAVVYDTSGSVPATPQNVYFGLQPSGSNAIFGYLRRVAIFSRALSDGELQALTT